MDVLFHSPREAGPPAIATACNSGSSTPSTTETTAATITIPMGDTPRNVSVLANQTTRVVFTHAIPPTTVTSWKPNLAATISQIHITVPAPLSVLDALALVRAAATESVSLSVRVAPASQRSTVCTTSPFGGSVQLTVTQDSTGKASYTDEGGTTFLCGGVCTDTLARR